MLFGKKKNVVKQQELDIFNSMQDGQCMMKYPMVYWRVQGDLALAVCEYGEQGQIKIEMDLLDKWQISGKRITADDIAALGELATREDTFPGKKVELEYSMSDAIEMERKIHRLRNL